MRLSLLTLLFAACSDYGVHNNNPTEDPYPSLAVRPPELFFADVPQEEREEQALTLLNRGDARLHIDELRITGSDAFSLEDDDLSFELGPGEHVTLPVRFSPGAEIDEGALEIVSDDPYGPVRSVDLQGTGLFPRLEVDPAEYDYGEVVLDCGWEKTFTLRNAGEALLRISAVAHSGSGYSLVQAPPLPVELEPGGEAEVVLGFNPLDEGEAEGTLLFETNEREPGGDNLQTGQGIPPNSVTDSWRQPDGPWEKTDIMFYVDQSGSMDDDQRNLASNFSAFITALDEVLADYRIMAVTADNGCHNGEIISPETTNAEAIFTAAVRGPAGQWTEAGLTIALAALQESVSGGCNDGFAREDAKVMPVLVSDEPEQSRSNWADLVTQIQAVNEHASISAIAGPVPGGCGSAAAGFGYYEASMASGGLFYSICDSDWGENLRDLAILVTAAPMDTFPLTGRPVREDSIVVTIDGSVTTRWAFDPEEVTVVFAEPDIPPPLSWVEISYDLGCDG
ncbi:MAG: choice-of-anchor D domain-containing protein [Pseudomonadota bacterium]